MPAAESLAFAREANDVLARAVAKHPDCFAGFAHLPWTAPETIPDELECGVNDLASSGRWSMGPPAGSFWMILATNRC